MIERLDSPFSGNYPLSRTYERGSSQPTTHIAYRIPYAVYTFPPPLLPFTDEDPLSTQKRLMDFPLPIFSLCALLLVPAAPYRLRLGHNGRSFPPLRI
jgi:hypothetical protein